MATYKAGDRVATVGRLGSKQAKTSGGFSVPIWTGKVYEAQARKSDGVLTWRLVEHFGGTRSGDKPSETFLAELHELAEHPWLGVSHGQRCNDETVSV